MFFNQNTMIIDMYTKVMPKLTICILVNPTKVHRMVFSVFSKTMTVTFFDALYSSVSTLRR